MKQKGKPPLTVVDSYKRWVYLQDKMGQTVLKFAAHPDCTLQQLWLVKMQYSERQQQFEEMRKQLRAMFWDTPYERYPWNNS